MYKNIPALSINMIKLSYLIFFPDDLDHVDGEGNNNCTLFIMVQYDWLHVSMSLCGLWWVEYNMPIAYYLNKAAHLCDESILMATIKSTFGIQYKDGI